MAEATAIALKDEPISCLFFAANNGGAQPEDATHAPQHSNNQQHSAQQVNPPVQQPTVPPISEHNLALLKRQIATSQHAFRLKILSATNLNESRYQPRVKREWKFTFLTLISESRNQLFSRSLPLMSRLTNWEVVRQQMIALGYAEHFEGKDARFIRDISWRGMKKRAMNRRRTENERGTQKGGRKIPYSMEELLIFDILDNVRASNALSLSDVLDNSFLGGGGGAGGYDSDINMTSDSMTGIGGGASQSNHNLVGEPATDTSQINHHLLQFVNQFPSTSTSAHHHHQLPALPSTSHHHHHDHVGHGLLPSMAGRASGGAGGGLAQLQRDEKDRVELLTAKVNLYQSILQTRRLMKELGAECPPPSDPEVARLLGV